VASGGRTGPRGAARGALTDAEAALWQKVFERARRTHSPFRVRRVPAPTAALGCRPTSASWPDVARLAELKRLPPRSVPGSCRAHFYGGSPTLLPTTQYLRTSVPFYPPSPHHQHGARGHACMLASASGRPVCRRGSCEPLQQGRGAERFSKGVLVHMSSAWSTRTADPAADQLRPEYSFAAISAEIPTGSR